ncbi:hypothetical protein HETIRDRAFT_315458, partial [Heterobasidion irregulare TC 32-1]
VKCGRTDPSAAERPSVACRRSGRDRPCSVIVGVFGTCLALFGVSPKLPEYLPRTLARVHAHHLLPTEILTVLSQWSVAVSWSGKSGVGKVAWKISGDVASYVGK